MKTTVRDETVLVLTPVENRAQNELAKYIYDYLLVPVRFDLYFFHPLKTLFSKVILYDYLTKTLELGVGGLNEDIIKLVRKEQPKYVLWNTMYWYGIRETTLDSIRKEGTTIIGWFLDDEVGFDNYSKWWIPYIDFFVTDSVDAVQKYQQLHARAMHAPLTGNGSYHDWSQSTYKYDVSFVGRRYVDREEFIQCLINKDISVHVFGREWQNCEHIKFDEMTSVFQSSKINLNFSKVTSQLKQIKGRVFEICLAGGFLLTEYADHIENYFQVGKEIVCFSSKEDLCKKVQYYLEHDEERRKIAKAGWDKATGRYTCARILSSVFEEADKAAAISCSQKIDSKEKTGRTRFMSLEFSRYYLAWGVALLKENQDRLCKEALRFSIAYNPWNSRAWTYFLISYLPAPGRTTVVDMIKIMGKVKRFLKAHLKALSHAFH